jgi:tetratricopeptide (TPR) repeat protein
VRRRRFPAAVLLAGTLAGACAAPAGRATAPKAAPDSSPAPEAISLLGEPLFPPALAAERREELEARLSEARERYEKNPADADAAIWLGRRTAYLGRYREAIALFTEGMTLHPEDPRFYRHRGHRYITTRRFDLAVADLSRGRELARDRPDEIEPDGLPNARNIPTSTTNSNIGYHLGLAHYLRGEFEQAASAYQWALGFSRNPDMLVATTHWLFMTLRRLGRAEEAARLLQPITEGMDVIENQEYHRLLLMYQGKVSRESLLEETARTNDPLALATVGYGVGSDRLFSGRTEEAIRIFRRVLETGEWAAFGYIAAEAELARPGHR